MRHTIYKGISSFPSLFVERGHWLKFFKFKCLTDGICTITPFIIRTFFYVSCTWDISVRAEKTYNIHRHKFYSVEYFKRKTLKKAIPFCGFLEQEIQLYSRSNFFWTPEGNFSMVRMCAACCEKTAELCPMVHECGVLITEGPKDVLIISIPFNSIL